MLGKENLRILDITRGGSGTYALESDREGENKVLKGYERIPLLPNNKSDNKKIIRSKGESFKQKQVVSPPSSQRGEETHLPTEMEMRERSSQILREINRRRKLKLAQEEREEQEELMLRLNGPEAERKRRVARQIAEQEKKEELESPGESKEDE